MITTPLIKESEKQPAHFSRRFLGIALLAFALLGCFAFSVMSNEEAVGEPGDKESTIPIVEVAVGEGRFNTIGMELEFHQCNTKNQLPYDSLLYTSKTTLANGSPLFKIVAETSKKLEVVTGVINGAQTADMEMLRDWIKIGKELSLGSVAGQRKETLKGFGQQFDYLKTGTVEADPGPADTDKLVWKAGSPWSPQLTAQGPPEPHLSMIQYACKEGIKVNQTPPPEANTAILKLQWIVQTEMCRGVLAFMTSPGISETKEAICFLPKATNIRDFLARGEESFGDWCLEAGLALKPNLGTMERNGPGHDTVHKYNYALTVEDLLKWADGTTKTETLGEDSNFPLVQDDDVRIEYRRAQNFFVLQQTITGGTMAAKAITGLDVVKALFLGCIPRFNSINTVKTDCAVP